jgi:hypothetical protein
VQARVSQLVGIDSGGVHAGEPVEHATGALGGEDGAVDLVLAFQLEPVVVAIFEEIGGHKKGEPLDAFGAVFDPGLDQARLKFAGHGRQVALLDMALAFGIGPGQPHQRVGGRFGVEFDVHAAVLAILGGVHDGDDAAGVGDGPAGLEIAHHADEVGGGIERVLLQRSRVEMRSLSRSRL